MKASSQNIHVYVKWKCISTSNSILKFCWRFEVSSSSNLQSFNSTEICNKKLGIRQPWVLKVKTTMIDWIYCMIDIHHYLLSWLNPSVWQLKQVGKRLFTLNLGKYLMQKSFFITAFLSPIVMGVLRLVKCFDTLISSFISFECVSNCPWSMWSTLLNPFCMLLLAFWLVGWGELMSNKCVAREFYSQKIPKEKLVEVFSHISKWWTNKYSMIVFKHVRVSLFIYCFK
jgi:hypothetical protein